MSKHAPELLFAAPVQSRETDERYTPAWIFDALGETFDLDPASPPLGVSRVPTTAVWTKSDDGLTQPWHGFVRDDPAAGPRVHRPYSCAAALFHAAIHARFRCSSRHRAAPPSPIDSRTLACS